MVTVKKSSPRDAEQTQRLAYNDDNATISVDGFIVGMVGRKVTVTIDETTVPDDTEIYDFSELGVALYQITIIYTDGARTQMLSAERTA